MPQAEGGLIWRVRLMVFDTKMCICNANKNRKKKELELPTPQPSTLDSLPPLRALEVLDQEVCTMLIPFILLFVYKMLLCLHCIKMLLTTPIPLKVVNKVPSRG